MVRHLILRRDKSTCQLSQASSMVRLLRPEPPSHKKPRQLHSSRRHTNHPLRRSVEGGISCTGNRDLYDDFGVAASPTTGLASIIYSNDQYVNTSNEPAAPGCTSSTTNTGSCDHTDIATQTSGPGIFP